MDAFDTGAFFGQIFGMVAVLAIIGVVIYSLMKQKKKQLQCDSCGKLVGTEAPYILMHEGKQLDFCSKNCETNFQQTTEEA